MVVFTGKLVASNNTTSMDGAAITLTVTEKLIFGIPVAVGSFTASAGSDGSWTLDTGFLADQLNFASFTANGKAVLPVGSSGAWQGKVADVTAGPPGYTADAGTTTMTYSPWGQIFPSGTFGTLITWLIYIAVIIGIVYGLYWFFFKRGRQKLQSGVSIFLNKARELV